MVSLESSGLEALKSPGRAALMLSVGACNPEPRDLSLVGQYSQQDEVSIRKGKGTMTQRWERIGDEALRCKRT